MCIAQLTKHPYLVNTVVATLWCNWNHCVILMGQVERISSKIKSTIFDDRFLSSYKLSGRLASETVKRNTMLVAVRNPQGGVSTCGEGPCLSRKPTPSCWFLYIQALVYIYYVGKTKTTHEYLSQKCLVLNICHQTHDSLEKFPQIGFKFWLTLVTDSPIKHKWRAINESNSFKSLKLFSVLRERDSYNGQPQNWCYLSNRILDWTMNLKMYSMAWKQNQKQLLINTENSFLEGKCSIAWPLMLTFLIPTKTMAKLTFLVSGQQTDWPTD